MSWVGWNFSWVQLFGVDSLRAGNVVQIVMVAGLTIGWISSYILRVSSKDMTYAKQLKDYENKVMEVKISQIHRYPIYVQSIFHPLSSTCIVLQPWVNLSMHT